MSTESNTTFEITTTLPDVDCVDLTIEQQPESTKKKRNRPRVSLEKWALFQNDSFPELYYRSIKAIIKDRKTHHLKMSQITKMLETPGIITPLGRIRKCTRAERLIWFPNQSTTSFQRSTGTLTTLDDEDEVIEIKPRRHRKPKIEAQKSSIVKLEPSPLDLSGV
jgi:hypothetical protein